MRELVGRSGDGLGLIHVRAHAHKVGAQRRGHIDAVDTRQIHAVHFEQLRAQIELRRIAGLANIYLHYVFDLWAKRWRKHQAGGQAIFVRYADDVVVGVQHQADAKRILVNLRQRVEEFPLSLHPVKTRLMESGRFAAANRSRCGLGKPQTFNFLEFTHICGRSLRGAFLLPRKTRGDRMRVKLREIKDELRRRWHDSIVQQGQWLAKVVRGYFNYHALPTDAKHRGDFLRHVLNLWRRALKRRSQRERATWTDMTPLAAAFLPPVRILQPWPDARFAAKHPRWGSRGRLLVQAISPTTPIHVIHSDPVNPATRYRIE